MVPSPKSQAYCVGPPEEEVASKVIDCPGSGEAGEKVKLAFRLPVPEIATGFKPTALPQAELTAETAFVPGSVQVTETCAPVAEPAIAPPPVLQVQPLGLGEQPVAVAVKVYGVPVSPESGPATSIAAPPPPVVPVRWW